MAKEGISRQQRDELFARLRKEPRFRQMMKKDWRAVLKEAEIDPEAVAKGTLSREEIEQFAQQRAAWTIVIVISARLPFAGEQIKFSEAVNFEKR